jgi:hypothetical protein
MWTPTGERAACRTNAKRINYACILLRTHAAPTTPVSSVVATSSATDKDSPSTAKDSPSTGKDSPSTGKDSATSNGKDSVTSNDTVGSEVGSGIGSEVGTGTAVAGTGGWNHAVRFELT